MMGEDVGSQQPTDADSFRRMVSVANTERPGFGNFIVDLESYLTDDTVWKLSMLLEFSDSENNRVERARNPNTVFIKIAMEKGFVTAWSIARLSDGLKQLGLMGIFDKVESSWIKNMTPEVVVPSTQQTIPPSDSTSSGASDRISEDDESWRDMFN